MGKLNEPEGLPRVTGTPWPGVKYFSTTRAGGVSEGAFGSLNLAVHVGDGPDKVRRNRERLAGILPAPANWLEQVHGAEVVEIKTSPKPRTPIGVRAPRADAAVTFEPGCVLAVMTADCLPVVMTDHAASVVGVAHAGWRGLAAGVLENTVMQLHRQLGPDAALRAWIGPAISQSAFEVGADLREAFLDVDPATAFYFSEKVNTVQPGAQKWLADLPGLARHRLAAAGVQNIQLSGYCTFKDEDLFFSYRRASRTGRMATLAWLCNASD